MNDNNNCGAAGLWAAQHHTSFRGNISPVVVKREPECSSQSAAQLPVPALTTNSEEFVCSICEMFVIEEQGVVLKDCRHNFCRPCLVNVIERSPAIKVPCPMTVIQCDKIISFDEASALLSLASFNIFVQKPFEMRKRVHNTVPRLIDLEENHDFVENQVKFECPICMQPVEICGGIVLKNCLHEYCKECLARHIETTEDLVVPCPFVAEDGARCEGFLQDREMRSLITDEVYGAHLARSISQAEAVIANSFHCKAPDCVGWAEIDEQVTQFRCPVCNKTSCVKCNADARKSRDNGLTEAQLREMLNSRQAMPCPRCGVIIQKTVGCNHMTCTRCKHEFQWFGMS